MAGFNTNPYNNMYPQYGYNQGGVYSQTPMSGGTIPNYPQQSIPQPQYSPQNTRSGLNGCLINKIDDVRPSDVPMDGSVSLFPYSDYSCIYAKAWNSDGTIRTVKFIPATDNENVKNAEVDAIAALTKRIDELESKVNKKQKKVENDE